MVKPNGRLVKGRNRLKMTNNMTIHVILFSFLALMCILVKTTRMKHVAEMGFWGDLITKAKVLADSDSEHSALPPLIDTETNVYCFGILMLEIISGKLLYSDEGGPLVAWAAQYLHDKRNTSHMVDPTLNSFKQNELDVICEVIEECIQQDARKRPTIKEAITKLREVLQISPEQAIPRLSPLWWAELEILSGEAA